VGADQRVDGAWGVDRVSSSVSNSAREEFLYDFIFKAGGYAAAGRAGRRRPPAQTLAGGERRRALRAGAAPPSSARARLTERALAAPARLADSAPQLPPTEGVSVHLVGQQANIVLGVHGGALAVIERQQPDRAVPGEPDRDGQIDRIHSPY
jgi:hypothetical protein